MLSEPHMLKTLCSYSRTGIERRRGREEKKGEEMGIGIPNSKLLCRTVYTSVCVGGIYIGVCSNVPRKYNCS